MLFLCCWLSATASCFSFSRFCIAYLSRVPFCFCTRLQARSSPVRSPELPSYRGCVHRVATQQLGLTVFTVAELKRTQPPLRQVPLARMSEYVLFPGTTTTLYLVFKAPVLLFLATLTFERPEAPDRRP